MTSSEIITRLLMLSAQLEGDMRFEAQRTCDEAAALIITMRNLDHQVTSNGAPNTLATVQGLFDSLVADYETKHGV